MLDRMLREPRQPGGDGSLGDAVVRTWTDTSGTLADGGTVRLATSCLVRPDAGDRVLVFSATDGIRWILSVLERAQGKAAVVAAPTGLTIEAPRISLAAEEVHIQAEDFLTSTRNRHAVEQVRTETVRTRVAQVGTDIRRASHASDEVEGTVLHRAGTWISNTVREARLHAKAFLFD